MSSVDDALENVVWAAAQEMGVWPAGTQAVEHSRRTCGGCDLSDVSESAVASAVLTLHGPTVDTMQDEIIRQIQETTAFRERAEVAGF